MRASEFVQSYFDAWNHGDPVAVADHLADNGVYCDVTENTHRSHDELILSLQRFFASNRHRYELIGGILENADTIAFQYRMFPLVKGRKDRSADPIRGSEFVTFNGDTALTIYDYYEIAGGQNRPKLSRASAGKSIAAKYAKSGLSMEQLNTYKARLENVMNTQKVYLESDMTLPKLAKLINCSVNHLSQVINVGFNMSFFDYLNQFRVEFAKGLLAEPEGQNNSVLYIAFAVGYNSNSAFYSAFKKYVGLTPAEYRRRQSRVQ
ncbi:MAG: helix-turn-helix domain-containing protein [Pseudomonadota bacterium]